jgi:hypothetical protein
MKGLAAMSWRWRRQRRQWQHEGATAPLAPSHASSRAGRPPASVSGGGRMGSIGGAPEHNGEGVRNPSRRRCSARPSENKAGQIKGVAEQIRRWRIDGGWWQRRAPSEQAVGGKGDARGVWSSRARGKARALVGRFDRSVDQTDLVWLRPADQPGQSGPRWAGQASWALAY